MLGTSFADILGSNSTELNNRASAVIQQMQVIYSNLNMTNLKSQVLFGLEHPAAVACGECISPLNNKKVTGNHG